MIILHHFVLKYCFCSDKYKKIKDQEDRKEVKNHFFLPKYEPQTLEPTRKQYRVKAKCVSFVSLRNNKIKKLSDNPLIAYLFLVKIENIY